jgi:U3 small nucleolar RNA-associated protein 23
MIALAVGICCATSMPHLQELLMRLLGAEVKLFTTPCVGKELRSLGTDFAAAAQFARGQQLHKCTHNPVVEPSECLLDAVAGGNPAHWLIATQVPHTAVLFYHP